MVLVIDLLAIPLGILVAMLALLGAALGCAVDGLDWLGEWWRRRRGGGG